MKAHRYTFAPCLYITHLLLTSHLLPSSQLLITHALPSQVLCQLSSDFLVSVVEALSFANGNTQGCH